MIEADLETVIRAWDEAMVANDAEAIGRFMGEEWVIVGQDGSVTGKDRFLSFVASGDLTHNVMTSEDIDLRLYGDTAVVIALGVSAGTYRGQRFREEERGSNVFVRRDGRWVCVLTHLSRLGASKAGQQSGGEQSQ